MVQPASIVGEGVASVRQQRKISDDGADSSGPLGRGHCPVACGHVPCRGLRTDPFSIAAAAEPKAKSARPSSLFCQKARSFSKSQGRHAATAGALIIFHFSARRRAVLHIRTIPPLPCGCCMCLPSLVAEPRWMRWAGEWHAHARARGSAAGRSCGFACDFPARDPCPLHGDV